MSETETETDPKGTDLVPGYDYEIDEARWLSPDDAAGQLSYERDNDVLQDAVGGHEVP